jgi:beta-barrel assembly-enhancing protease
MIPMNRHISVLFLFVSLSLLAPGCSTLMHVNVFPVSKDIELGKQMDREIKSHPKEYPLLQNRSDVKQYIESIGWKIIASPEIKYRDQFAYQFEVIQDDSTVNAFCTPGGYVYVYTGLLKFLDNEASLAGVIAHEIAHAEKRHATNKMSTQYGLETVLGLAGSKMGESGAQVAGVVAGLGLLKYNRTEEEEADTYSFQYLKSTEYFPGAIIFFFQKVDAGNSGGAMERLLSTHPLPKDRYEHMNTLIAEYGSVKPSESTLFTERYKKFKESLP